MENYAGLIVYLWSIWGGIVGSIVFITIALGAVLLTAVIVYFTSKEASDEKMEIGSKNYLKKLYKPFVGLWVLAILIPSKENMLLIIAANPVAKTIVESATDGKLSKLNQLTDIALDKAILKLKEGE
jgi:hypothetical protein